MTFKLHEVLTVKLEKGTFPVTSSCEEELHSLGNIFLIKTKKKKRIYKNTVRKIKTHPVLIYKAHWQVHLLNHIQTITIWT